MKEGCCYVCLDEERGEELFRVCRCSTLVHSDCFAQTALVVPSHSSECPVCKRPFVHTVARHPLFLRRVVLLVFMTGCWVTSLALFLLASGSNEDLVFLIVVASGLGMSQLVGKLSRESYVTHLASAREQQASLLALTS